MKDYFIWNGEKSTVYGVHVSEQPPITLPAERTTETIVPGRPGSLTTLEGDDVYDDLLLTATCFVADTSRITDIGRWLKGGGTVTFANRLDGYYKARVVNQIPFEKILRGNPHCSFAVNFRCFPFWYLENVPDITVTQSNSIITNPGSVFSEPVITVYGSDAMTLMVGTTIIELEDVPGSIVIDSVLKEAYWGNTLLNDHMSDDFPILTPGANGISWTGNVSRLVITPNWRTL